jgi:osomolarity two-component system, response regulator SKN7
VKKPSQDPNDGSASQISDLQNQVDSLTRCQDTLTKHLQGLSEQYQMVVSKMLNFQQTLDNQDNVMQNIIKYIADPEANPSGLPSDATPFFPGDQAQKLIGSLDEAAKASVDIMNDLSQLGASLAPSAMANQINAPQTIRPSHLQDPLSYPPTTISPPLAEQTKREYHTPSGDSQLHVNTSFPETVESETPFSEFGSYQFPLDQPSGDSQNTGGLRVFTVGHLAPRVDNEQNNPEISGIRPPPNMPIVKDHDERPPHSVRVRRQTLVPGWAVPPKILLVDDDAVFRNMSSKFLQVFGCEADVAVDGLSALDKVNVEKYDLILMDVVMPNLDGISATSLIRQFDLATPIISMTSNIRSNDIMHYFNSGASPQ